MKVRDLYIEACDWRVRLYLSVTCYYTDRICRSLKRIGCPEAVLSRARRAMERCQLDTGLTYSNKSLRQSVVVVAPASSPAQFLNSFEHELRHLTDHILEASDYAIGGEEVAYLTGDLNSLLWEHIHPFVCHCGGGEEGL